MRRNIARTALLLVATAGAALVADAQVRPKPLTSFAEVVAVLRTPDGAENDSMSVRLCTALGLDTRGQTLVTRWRSASNQTENKNISLGVVGRKEVVVLVAKLRDNSSGHIYVTDRKGRLLRAYYAHKPEFRQLTAEEARAGFAAEKQWWVEWVSQHRTLPQETAKK